LVRHDRYILAGLADIDPGRGLQRYRL
jgi:hypothetical protein